MSFLAWDGFHRFSQSSVNCSRKSALSLVGYRSLSARRKKAMRSRAAPEARLMAIATKKQGARWGGRWQRTVKVGSSGATEDAAAAALSSWTSSAYALLASIAAPRAAATELIRMVMCEGGRNRGKKESNQTFLITCDKVGLKTRGKHKDDKKRALSQGKQSREKKQN
jgi:hypothetical protein